MKAKSIALVIATLLVITLGQASNGQNCQATPYDTPQLIPIKKGLTYQANEWPSRQNHWVGKMACEGCNPKDGDTPCTVKLPLLCILHHKSLDRPFYFYQPDLASYEKKDGGFFNSWTGGLLLVTDSIRGLDITSFEKGDRICKDYYGFDAKFAEFHDGYYLDDMNGYVSGSPLAWATWSWKQAKCGQWSLWGYFNHHWTGRAWIWINNQPNGNCGQI